MEKFDQTLHKPKTNLRDLKIWSEAAENPYFTFRYYEFYDSQTAHNHSRKNKDRTKHACM